MGEEEEDMEMPVGVSRSKRRGVVLGRVAPGKAQLLRLRFNQFCKRKVRVSKDSTVTLIGSANEEDVQNFRAFLWGFGLI